MKREDDEKLWDLLGHNAEPKVSPFFARNVLRKVREEQAETPARRWFNVRWLVPASGLAVAVVAAVMLRVQVPRQTTPPISNQIVLSEMDDGDLMSDLDDLVGDDADDLALL
jgi:hypothetical protein